MPRIGITSSEEQSSSRRKRIKAFKRIGNETHEGHEETFAADVMTEAGGKGEATRRTQANPE